MVRPTSWARVDRASARRPLLREIPDEELMIAYVVHDDARAFDELYRRLSPSMLRYALRRVRTRDRAEDLVQQAFLNAHLARDRFQLGSPARPWLTRILVNLVHDHLRGVRLRPKSEIEPADLPAPDREPEHERAETISITRRAVARLEPRQRAVVELHWLQERPFPEVASELGEHVSTVKVRAHRAYKELRRTLGTGRGKLDPDTLRGAAERW
jgi:RNA polymerase sigma-70 factor (ECF subfamily)